MQNLSGIPLLQHGNDSDEYIDLYESNEPQTKSYYQRLSPSLFTDGSVFLLSVLHLTTTRPLGVRCGRSRSRNFRLAILVLNFGVLSILLLIIISIADALLHPSYSNPPAHYAELKLQAETSAKLGRGNPNNEQIFIASNIIQANLIRTTWGPTLLRLVDLLGPENVFVSIYENDSGPSTSEALQHLRAQLPCQHSIATGAHMPLSDFPSFNLPNGQRRVKRITYLSQIRNQLLAPLDVGNYTLSNRSPSLNRTERHFDRILFLNDIFFDPIEALQLLFSTNKLSDAATAQYDVACATDFVASVMFYDSFVVRDNEGYGIGLMFYPWFATKGRAESREDVLAGKDAVRVRSCWGGMAAYGAAPFLRATATDLSNSPLRFRHQKELYWEAAECCLLNADIAERVHEPKIFLNPYVRVAYDEKSWSWLPFIRRIERVFTILQGIVSRIGYPEFNPRRTERAGELSSHTRWIYSQPDMNGEEFRDQNETVPMNALHGKWMKTVEVAAPGGFCGQKRLFLMKPDIQRANEAVERAGRNWEKGIWPLPRI